MSWASLVTKKAIDSSMSYERVEICECCQNTSKIVYDSSTNSYKYEGLCNENRICASIMRDKHKIRMLDLLEGINSQFSWDP